MTSTQATTSNNKQRGGAPQLLVSRCLEGTPYRRERRRERAVEVVEGDICRREGDLVSIRADLRNCLGGCTCMAEAACQC